VQIPQGQLRGTDSMRADGRGGNYAFNHPLGMDVLKSVWLPVHRSLMLNGLQWQHAVERDMVFDERAPASCSLELKIMKVRLFYDTSHRDVNQGKY
jgi:hypothetical protein